MLDAWLSRLASLDPAKIKPGLARMQQAMQAHDLPPLAKKTILVAGTNGKGSVCALLEQLAIQGGLRTGVYSSPHFICLNERVRICGQPVPEQAFVSAFETVEACSEGIDLSYFEWVTLAAFKVMSGAELDLAIVEVGLGGRLDATNVIDPDLSVITKIGFDHQEWLGNSLEAIAREKAGITREGIPCVLSSSSVPSVVVDEIAERGVRVIDVDQINEIPVSQKSSVAELNQRLAHACCRQLGLKEQESFNYIASSLVFPGRFQVVRREGLTWILDVAHNEDSVELLASRLVENAADNIRVVFGCLSDKPVHSMLQCLSDIAAHWYLSDLPDSRAMSVADISESFPYDRSADVKVFSGMALALECVQKEACEGDIVLVTGSFVSVAQAMTLLNFPAVPYLLPKES